VRLRAQEAIRGRLGGPPRALFFAGDPSGETVFQRDCALVNGGLEFGTPPPGRYTLWLNVAPWAPLVLRDIEVSAEDLDLGVREFPIGSSVRVHMLVGLGEAAPRLSVWAHSKNAPVYSRGLNSRGETDAVLRGLGPGSFQVMAMPIMGAMPRTRMSYEIKVDGEATTIREIQWDLQ